MSGTGKCYPILCNQENFLLRANSYKIKQTLKGAHVIIKSAEKSAHDKGRPKNGMFIAVPADIKECITDVSPNHWRVQAAIIRTDGSNVLLINTYFPTDPKVNEFDSSELFTTLSAINELLQRKDYNSVVWTGDINAEFCRKTAFTKHIASFIEKNNLTMGWDKFPVDFTHVHEMNDTSHTSIIDHFIWSENMDENITDAGVLHLPNNFSDHCPIFCQVDINGMKQLSTAKPNSIPKPSWNTASDEQKITFHNNLEDALMNIVIDESLTKCEDVHCKDPNHHKHCDDLISNMLKNVDTIAAKHLTTEKCYGNKRDIPIAFWTRDVEPFKKDAHFWHSVWHSAGRPMNTELHRIMKRTRNIYHLQIRKCKNAANTLKRNALLDACVNGKGDIFTEIKKMRKAPAVVANSIDGITEGIPDHFAKIYSKLYNSIDEQNELNDLFCSIEDKIDRKSMTEILKITPDIVKDAAKHLKKKKNDPTYNFTSDCLINAPDIFFKQLSIIFRSYIIHGNISDILMLSTLVPIVKDKLGNLCSSDNYRSIAISSLVLKIFDWVLLLIFGDKLHLDDLQFGYQENCSTNMCTWMAVETVDHFMRNGSDIYACVMDMKKAFDTVQHSVLFRKLLGRGIPPVYIRLLMVMYGKQSANVKWNGSSSANFSIRNGVKQGAVLSAILFCVYINDLFTTLRKNRTGCWIDGDFFGVLGYADDIMLLSPTHDGLQEMVDTCATFMRAHNLTFSTHPTPAKCKTKCLAFMKKERVLNPINLNGNALPWVTTAKHLGTKINNNMKGVAQDLMEKRAVYINRNNELMQEFWFAHPKTIINTNNIFNTSLYGSVLWDLFGKEAERLEKSWNISQRLMLGLHRETHRYFLEPVSDTRHIIFHLYKRFSTFITNIHKNKKRPLRILCSAVQSDCRSTTGRNLRKIMKLFDAATFEELHENLKKKNTVYKEANVQDLWKIEAVKDLVEAKFDKTILPNFTTNEIDDLRDHISTC